MSANTEPDWSAVHKAKRIHARGRPKPQGWIVARNKRALAYWSYNAERVRIAIANLKLRPRPPAARLRYLDRVLGYYSAGYERAHERAHGPEADPRSLKRYAWAEDVISRAWRRG